MSYEKCSICRVPMDGTSQDYQLGCNHRFHTECIIDSLRHNPECPVCRDTGGVTVNNIFDDGYETPPLIHTNEPSHINQCAFCAKTNPSSELYEMYQLIHKLGNSLIQNKYNELKTLNHQFKELEDEFKHKLHGGIVDIKKKLERERQLLYHQMGKSDNFMKYRTIFQRTKIVNMNFKKDLNKQILELGYENDELLSKLVDYFYVNSVKKQKTNWSLKTHIDNCKKYSLKKYAPTETKQVNKLHILEI
jgi:hypothetical protein